MVAKTNFKMEEIGLLSVDMGYNLFGRDGKSTFPLVQNILVWRKYHVVIKAV
jgi:hypothetical protein